MSVESYSHTFQKYVFERCHKNQDRFLSRAYAELGFILCAVFSALETILRCTLGLAAGAILISIYLLIQCCSQHAADAIEGFLSAHVWPLLMGGWDAAYAWRDSLCLAFDNLWVADFDCEGLYAYFYREVGKEISYSQIIMDFDDTQFTVLPETPRF